MHYHVMMRIRRIKGWFASAATAAIVVAALAALFAFDQRAAWIGSLLLFAASAGYAVWLTARER